MKRYGPLQSKSLLREIAQTSIIVEKGIYKYITKEVGRKNGLSPMISYSLDDIGLRIRPFLLKNTYEIGGEIFNSILPLAIAIELMQTSTLVTDDILDESQMRNRKATVVKKWGYKKGFLVGECLKSIASLIVIENVPQNNKRENIQKIFEDTYLKICIGQIEDLIYEKGYRITEKQYLEMIEKTTALFIQAPIKIGALLCRFEPIIENGLVSYGINLGYAYQIRDDIIDLIGEPQCTGKPFAGDIKQRKARLPLIHFLSNSKGSKKSYVTSLLRKESINDHDALNIIEIMNECGSIRYSIQKCEEYCSAAIRKLSCLPECKQKSRFFDLASLIANFDN